MTEDEKFEYNTLKAEEWRGNHCDTDTAIGDTETTLQAKLALMRANKANRMAAIQLEVTREAAKWAKFKAGN
jgi:hypothetical protein